ncbi:MAG: hypothetical protein DMF89_23660 [Acidobacteria bacterium]|nr:MAG: hypothetical protein DMF90_19325 [Acidobacteriota bacterium]PYR45943.1 MAG: hypothetical protein DMF89_23660 [Acidobacteriota bacterium]
MGKVGSGSPPSINSIFETNAAETLAERLKTTRDGQCGDEHTDLSGSTYRCTLPPHHVGDHAMQSSVDI